MKSVKIIFNDVHKRLGNKTILNNEHFSIHSGEFNLLCGKNGEGKTTLLRIIAGLEKPNAASVNINNNVSSWHFYRNQLRNFSVYLHQHPYMLDGSVRKNLAYTLLQTSKTTKEKNHLIDEALELVQVDNIAECYAKTLSGGEQQRVALARAWLRQPNIMLLDEPTTNMDQESRNRTIDLLSHLKFQGLAICVASHDTEQFSSMADRTLTLQNGYISTDHHSIFSVSELTSKQVAA